MRQKFLLFILFLFIGVPALNCQTNAVGRENSSDEKVKPCKFLSFAEAEKILGQPVELVKNSWNVSDGATKLDCTYQAIEKDKASGRDIHLFFRLEESLSETKAKQIYADVWQSNKDHQGIEILSGIGDEAYSHSDKSNFYFVIARKGKFTIRLKINKAVETVSPEELKTFMKRVSEQL